MLSDVALGINPPPPDVAHIPVVVPPETVPLIDTFALFAQTVWSEPALTIIVGVIVSVCIAFGLKHPSGEIAFTVYVPELAVVAPAMVGFCDVELKLFGPLQEYVAPATVVAVKLIVLPWQTGPLLPALIDGV